MLIERNNWLLTEAVIFNIKFKFKSVCVGVFVAIITSARERRSTTGRSASRGFRIAHAALSQTRTQTQTD